MEGGLWFNSVPCPRQTWISIEDLSFSEELYHGEFFIFSQNYNLTLVYDGKIYKGKYGESTVAIKEFYSEVHEFKKQWELLRSLSSRYILKFFGATQSPKVL
jgi:hypothetical protein